MRQSTVTRGHEERSLHTALAAGDESAYREFVASHRKGMLRFAWELLGDGELAEEVVQDTFESVFRDIGGFRGEASLKTWTYRILANRARRVGKRESRTLAFSALAKGRDTGASRPLVDRLETADSSSSSFHARRVPDPQTAAINRQRLQQLAEGLRRLPERQREIVVLRDVEGHPSQEVTELLDISPGNQRVLLHRGRAALRAQLEQRDEFERRDPAAGQLWN
jgi:RNA polymerase sigma-70 factor (ECF subfamily)